MSCDLNQTLTTLQTNDYRVVLTFFNQVHIGIFHGSQFLFVESASHGLILIILESVGNRNRLHGCDIENF